MFLKTRFTGTTMIAKMLVNFRFPCKNYGNILMPEHITDVYETFSNTVSLSHLYFDSNFTKKCFVVQWIMSKLVHVMTWCRIGAKPLPVIYFLHIRLLTVFTRSLYVQNWFGEVLCHNSCSPCSLRSRVSGCCYAYCPRTPTIHERTKGQYSYELLISSIKHFSERESIMKTIPAGA